MLRIKNRWPKRSLLAVAVVAAAGMMTLGGATEAQARHGCGGYGYGGGYRGGYGHYGGHGGYGPRAVVVARPAYGHRGYGGYGGYGGLYRAGYGGGYGSYYGGRGVTIGFGF